MKLTQCFSVFFGLLALSVAGLAADPQPDQGKVQVENELYVFYLSEPTAAYEELGEVSPGLVWWGLPSELVRSVTRRARRKFDGAQAVIFLDKDMRRGKVIRFL